MTDTGMGTPVEMPAPQNGEPKQKPIHIELSRTFKNWSLNTLTFVGAAFVVASLLIQAFTLSGVNTTTSNTNSTAHDIKHLLHRLDPILNAIPSEQKTGAAFERTFTLYQVAICEALPGCVHDLRMLERHRR